MTPVPLPTPLPHATRHGAAVPLPGRGCSCRTCAFWAGPDGRGGPATVEPLCSGSNSDCSYCGCAHTEAAETAPPHLAPPARAAVPARTSTPAGVCAGCPIRCPSRTDIAAWMRDVGGTLAFDDVALPGALPVGLPRFIPQVDGSAVTDLDRHLHWPAYGVGLRRVFSTATRRIYPRFQDTNAHQVLGLATDQLTVLVGYGEDPLVEAYWTHRHRAGLIDQIAAGGWDLVLAPNFSIYGNWPRIEHLTNMRRSLVVAAELAAAGVAAVPNLYWFRLEDLHRWASWVDDADPPAVAVNAQTVRVAGKWDSWLLPGLTWLAQNLPEGLPVIITGISRADRLATVTRLFGPRLILVSQNAYQYALHGAVMTAAGRVDRHAEAQDAFGATVRYMASLVPPRPAPVRYPAPDAGAPPDGTR